VPGPMFMGVYLNEDHREQLETGTPHGWRFPV
jgi:hypothetical protein